MSIKHVRTSVSRWIALTAACFAPVPFGAVDDFWIGILILLFVVSLLLDPVADLVSSPRPVLIVLAMVAGLCGIVFIQMSPAVPAGWIDPIWKRAEALLGEPLTGRLAGSDRGPWNALGAPLLMALAFVRLYFLAGSRRAARQIVVAIGWSGVVLAIYSILAFVFTPDSLLGREKLAYTGNLTGTFVNRNTAATYFGSCAILWFVLALRDFQARFGTLSRVQIADALVHRLPRSLVKHALCFLLLISATAMTGSRAGLLLTVASLVMVLALNGFRGRDFFRLRVGLVAAVLVAGILLLEIAGGSVANRIVQAGLSDAARLEVYRTSLLMIAERPWLGAGLGSFEAIFPQFRPEVLGSFGIWDRAHNTLIELAVEIGLPATFAVFAAWCLAVFVLVRACRSQDSGASSSIPIALGVAMLGGLHSTVDFSLQIPGYAVTFAALLATGLAQALPAASGQTAEAGSSDKDEIGRR